MTAEQKHTVVIIPGLGDDQRWNIVALEFLTRNWHKKGITPLIHAVLWRDEEGFQPKFQKLLDLIDSLSEENIVSIIGASAGGSMAFNAFCAKKDVLHRVVNVCGRLRAGKHVIRSLENKAESSPAFEQSVHLFEHNEHNLTYLDWERMMTIRPIIDEVVPSATVRLAGAENLIAPVPEHTLGIFFSFLFSRQIIHFLQQGINS